MEMMEYDEFKDKLLTVCKGDEDAFYELLGAYDELYYEFKALEMKYKKLKEDMEDNYRPIPLDSEEMYGS